ncbi:hypothetical protein [Moorena sp. SIO3H5]|uniref:hypothetical protein n=1 Tax=Moorena sp. SIO3H5 TaxID=2607834 RepID=UPI0013BE0780|nr:hypothetical protein [Moorena sp. SIO3H5]NEO73874.1 hypothetical protein [Moorena sp. SIO3H5]
MIVANWQDASSTPDALSKLARCQFYPLFLETLSDGVSARILLPCSLFPVPCCL